MCLILIAHRQHPEYPLILLANRDEYFARLTQQPHVWPGEAHIIAGKDQTAYGTWLGINRYGDWGAVTNVCQDFGGHDLPAEYSRGLLVRQFLERNQQAAHFEGPLDFIQNRVLPSSHHYLPFNLLLGHQEEIYYCSNVGQVTQKLPEGLHGFSNGLIGTSWPKVERGLAQLENVLLQNKIDDSSLLAILQDETHFDKGTLHNELPLERSHYPIFIKGREYGTRQSTLILVDRQRRMTFKSISYDNLNEETTHIDLQLL